MRVWVDAQLPQRLAHLLSTLDIDAKHTQEERIVVSKDSDFLDSYILAGSTAKTTYRIGRKYQ